MVDIVEISAIITAAGVLVGVVYYVLEMRNQSRMRQTDLVVRLSSFYDNLNVAEAITKIVTTDFKDLNEFVKAISSPTLVMIGNFYDRTGALLKRRLIDVDLVNDIIIVKPVWEKMKPFVVYSRQVSNEPQLFEHFEYLYDEIKKREQAGVKSG